MFLIPRWQNVTYRAPFTWEPRCVTFLQETRDREVRFCFGVTVGVGDLEFVRVFTVDGPVSFSLATRTRTLKINNNSVTENLILVIREYKWESHTLTYHLHTKFFIFKCFFCTGSTRLPRFFDFQNITCPNYDVHASLRYTFPYFVWCVTYSECT